MNKRIFIVHGWGAYPQNDWFPWAKSELEKRGYQVLVPVMPDPMQPEIETWVSLLGKTVGQPDEDTMLIGHSIGCQTILRYLETLPEGQKIDKVICVAGWFSLTPETYEDEEDEKIARPWLSSPIDFEKVKTRANSFTVILSDNDPYVPLEENKKIFQEKLGAEVVVYPGQGHFDEQAGVTEFPELLKFI